MLNEKTITSFTFLLLTADINYSQVTTLWEKSAANTTNVVWNTGSVVRGLGYGKVGAITDYLLLHVLRLWWETNIYL